MTTEDKKVEDEIMQAIDLLKQHGYITIRLALNKQEELSLMWQLACVERMSLER